MLIVNDRNFLKKAKMIVAKGTNRYLYEKKKISKYTWTSFGSSYLLCESNCFLLFNQLKEIDKITNKRRNIWKKYKSFFNKTNYFQSISVSKKVFLNGHIFPIILSSQYIRNKLIDFFLKEKIIITSHYEPLHLSKMGKKYGYYKRRLLNTENIANTIIRLPIFYDLTEKELNKIFFLIKQFREKYKNYFLKKN